MYKVAALVLFVVLSAQGALLPYAVDDSTERDPCQGVPDGTFVANTQSCTEWYLCIDFKSKPGSCKEGFYYDRRKQMCNYKDEVECEKEQNPCAGKPDETFIEDPYSCNGYYVCIKQKKLAGTCPDDLIFNPNTSECVHKDSYKCEKPPQKDGAIACKGKPDYCFVDNEQECGKYYLCINQKAKSGECPKGYLFNAKKGICDFENEVHCEHVTPTPPPTKEPCEGKKDGTFLKDKDSCAGYYRCTNGKPVRGKCGSEYYFSEEKQMCDYKENVKCATADCEGRKNGEFFTNPTSCDAFYQCVDGHRKSGKCPQPYYFNSDTKECDYVQNVDCGARPTVAPPPTTTTSTTSKPTETTSSTTTKKPTEPTTPSTTTKKPTEPTTPSTTTKKPTEPTTPSTTTKKPTEPTTTKKPAGPPIPPTPPTKKSDGPLSPPTPSPIKSNGPHAVEQDDEPLSALFRRHYIDNYISDNNYNDFNNENYSDEI